MEDAQRTVILYGSSLFMACVEASLKGKSGLDVVQMNASLADAGKHLAALTPDAVIFDLDTPGAQSAVHFLKEHPDLPLIGLGLTHSSVVVLSSQQFTSLTADDLDQFIQKQSHS